MISIYILFGVVGLLAGAIMRKTGIQSQNIGTVIGLAAFIGIVYVFISEGAMESVFSFLAFFLTGGLGAGLSR